MRLLPDRVVEDPGPSPEHSPLSLSVRLLPSKLVLGNRRGCDIPCAQRRRFERFPGLHPGPSIVSPEVFRSLLWPLGGIFRIAMSVLLLCRSCILDRAWGRLLVQLFRRTCTSSCHGWVCRRC